MELGVEPIPAAPGATGGLKLSSEGNWKGIETGTRPPSMPKPRGRLEEFPRRVEPVVDACGRWDVVEDVGKLPEDDQPLPAFELWLVPPTVLDRCM